MTTNSRDYRLALVLSGGNALGAYQAGAWQALEEHGLTPDWIAGASAGAINGALICGSAPEKRIDKLAALWRPASDSGATPTPWSAFDTARRTASAITTLASGHPGIFVPRALYGPWFNPFGNTEPASMYDALPLQATLEQMVDFERLNLGAPRYSATAVDIESGEDIVFDTRAHSITATHVRASAALLPAFPPVEIEGRLLGDAGISANLPIDAVLSEPHDSPLLLIAIDLLPLRAPRPETLGDTLSRSQDLMFATQSRRAIAAWQAIFAERAKAGDRQSVTLLHIAYTDQGDEVSGKAFDFSPHSTAARWRAGHDDLAAVLGQLGSATLPIGNAGLTVLTPGKDRGPLEPVHWQLGPRRG